MPASASTTAPKTRPPRHPARESAGRVLPGLAVALAAALAAVGTAALIPGLSPLLVAIVLGIAARNMGLLPERLSAGLGFAGRVPLRLGIVVLGLQLSLTDLAALGWGIPALAVCVVVVGILATVLLGRLLRVPARQALLVACGFSICGAAAVAGVESVVDADEEETVTAVALVVLFGVPVVKEKDRADMAWRREVAGQLVRAGRCRTRWIVERPTRYSSARSAMETSPAA